LVKVSIVIPVYNVKPYLKRCLNSVFSQGYTDFEIILIDDCSTDGSYEEAKRILNDWEGSYKILKHEVNKGLGAARNTGISVAKGEFFSFLDSDDWISSDFLEKLVRSAEEDNAEIVICEYYKYWEDNQKQHIKSTFTLKDLTNKNLCIALATESSCDKLFKSSLFYENNIIFAEGIKSEDVATVPRLIARASRVSIVPEPLYFYFQRKGSLSLSSSFKVYDLKKAFEITKDDLYTNYKDEVEFFAIRYLVYGLTLNMIKSNFKHDTIKEHLEEIRRDYPNYINNKYLYLYNFPKRVFVKFAYKNRLSLLKLLTKLHGILV
jgi:glycosyltransferase involved in cell wall biosynthesis